MWNRCPSVTHKLQIPLWVLEGHMIQIRDVGHISIILYVANQERKVKDNFHMERQNVYSLDIKMELKITNCEISKEKFCCSEGI